VKRLTLTAGFVFAVAVPGVAQAKLSHSQNVAYGRAYAHVVHVFGKQAAGCKLIGPGANCRSTSDAMVLRSTETLHRMFVPVRHYSSSTPVLTSVGHTQGTYTTGSVSAVCGGVTPYPGGGSCWAIPYSIVLCESGGRDVSNSQGSGATGYYQLMSGGGGSRSEQDQAAARLWNGGRGRSNWVC